MDHGSFKEFFECWLMEQKNYMEELVKASDGGQSLDHVERVVVPLLERVIKHYELYYKTKSECAKKDVFGMLHPSWRSSFEGGFLWIGGWRPSLAFHLLYSITGLQLEARLSELLEGMFANDLSELTAAQLHQINELQARTIREEREITEEIAKHQETMADSAMVELSHMATELIRESKGVNGVVGVDSRVESTLAPKTAGMVEILRTADDLRLSTLKNVLQILNPIESVYFLIAGAELHLRVHDWGKQMDVLHAAANMHPWGLLNPAT